MSSFIHSRLKLLLPLVFSTGFFFSTVAHAQPDVQPALRTSDLFSMQVIGSGPDRYINVAPDSTTGASALDRRSAALWPGLMYLFENHSKTAAYVWELQPLLPDTELIRAHIDSSFSADTAFSRMYAKALMKEPVANLSIDAALRIAAHFFYLHSDNGKPVVHICVGINKVNTLSTDDAHPYHAAFCYQAIWEMDDYSPLLNKVKGPYSKEFKEHPPSEQRILEVEQLIYAGMAALPDLRQVLIDTYVRHKDHLNFQLVY
jgi:hypothetical protein